jgi:hypothetical protein
LSPYTGEKNATYEEPRQHCGDGRFCSHNAHDNTTSERKTPFPETGRNDALVIGNLQADFSRVTPHWEEILALLGQRALPGRVTRCPVRLRFNLGWLAAGKHRSAARQSRKRKSKGKGQMAKGKSEKPHVQKIHAK